MTVLKKMTHAKTRMILLLFGNSENVSCHDKMYKYIFYDTTSHNVQKNAKKRYPVALKTTESTWCRVIAQLGGLFVSVLQKQTLES